MSEDFRASTQQLRIYARHVYSGDGKVSGEMRVYCPDKARSMTLEHCMACKHWAGLHIDPRDHVSFLECAGAPEQSVPAASAGTRVSDVMTPIVVCVRPDLSVWAVLEMFRDERISAAPVIDEHARPLGVVSKTDLLAARNMVRGIDAPERFPATVQDLMTPLVFAIREHVPVPQAAGLMAVEGVRHVIVVAASGEVVGILSAIDVLRWVAERDGFLTSGHAAR
jgi:CBS-domain-containing membrane protein